MRQFLLFIVLYFVISTNTFAQDYKDNIQSNFEQYFTHLLANETDEAMDYIMPEVFEYISKEDFKVLLEEQINNPEFNIQFKTLGFRDFNSPQIYNQDYYAQLKHDYEMHVYYELEEGEDEFMKKLMLIMLQKEFGEEHVSHDEATDIYIVKRTHELIAKSKDGVTNWTFIVVEKEQLVLLDKFLPEDLLSIYKE